MEKRIQIITGHYGSGKTEFAVNLALKYAKAGLKTALADLDIVNPYFRSTERRALLEEHGVRVISTSFSGYVDLPAITPEVLAIFDDPSYKGVIDMGGDPEGAHVLGRFERQLARGDYDVLCVLNANRPETKTPEKAALYLKAIEVASGLKVTGLVNNTHLCRDTGVEDILKGVALTRAVSEETGVPVAYHAVERKFVDQVRYQLGEGELLPIDIYMCKPWEFGL
ncbi:MAG: hypothetical protein Q4E65_02870 [Clostridia bacterium]|nr:hypothetical protein [Clostridia bacterium]